MNRAEKANKTMHERERETPRLSEPRRNQQQALKKHADSIARKARSPSGRSMIGQNQEDSSFRFSNKSLTSPDS